MDETGNKGQRQQKTRKARIQRRKRRKEGGHEKQQQAKRHKHRLTFFGIAGIDDLINLPPLVHEVDSCDRVGP